MKKSDSIFVNELNYDRSLDSQISLIIDKSCLKATNNRFFIRMKNLKAVDSNAAFQIAYNWREITKTFLFTSIKGLGILAEKIGNQENPDILLLSVLQTGYGILSDDLGNTHPHFKEHAPFGTKGIHYKWWEETILNKFNFFLDHENGTLLEGTKALTDEMKRISSNPLGIAVQLRVVEAIALDICVSFLELFSNVRHEGIKIFNNTNDLKWITSHIQAETIHNEQVCNSTSGMARIATTKDEKKLLLDMTQTYSNVWSNALSDFACLFEESLK